MNWTREQYEAFIRNRSHHSRSGAGASHEKPKDVGQGSADNQARKTAMDAKSGGQHRVTVELLYSDRRRRDADGALTTLLDCLILARRRFLDLHPRN